MEDIIVSLEPAFHRVERFILWHNRYASLLAFVLGHCIFFAIARAGLRPFCAIVLVVLVFHILDCLKQKRLVIFNNEEQNLSELTQLVLRSYRHLCRTHERLNTLKTENRVKYSILIIAVCLTLAFIGVKINGLWVSYLTMLILFTLPAVFYHKLIPKLLQRAGPVLQQLDESMNYQRRSLLNQNELLVRVNRSNNSGDSMEDDEEVRRLKEKYERLKKDQSVEKPKLLQISDDEDEAMEHKLVNTTDESHTIMGFRNRYQDEIDSNDIAVVPKRTNINDSSFDMASDSSSSNADEEANRISELYANLNEDFDGKHRIKFKGDELKIKGRSGKQRGKLMDAAFFQPMKDETNSSASTLMNTTRNQPVAESDFASFDFLDDYEDKA